MASVESLDQAEEAWKMGWQTYRVGLPEERPSEDEIYCPHYTFEFEPKIQCLQCQLCSGIDKGISYKKGIFVNVHGSVSKRKSFRKLKEQKQDEIYSVR